jgi:hypothetical protein
MNQKYANQLAQIRMQSVKLNAGSGSICDATDGNPFNLARMSSGD